MINESMRHSGLIIWKSRNEFLFLKRNVHPIEDAKRAMEANDNGNICFFFLNIRIQMLFQEARPQLELQP